MSDRNPERNHFEGNSSEIPHQRRNSNSSSHPHRDRSLWSFGVTAQQFTEGVYNDVSDFNERIDRNRQNIQNERKVLLGMDMLIYRRDVIYTGDDHRLNIQENIREEQNTHIGANTFPDVTRIKLPPLPELIPNEQGAWILPDVRIPPDLERQPRWYPSIQDTRSGLKLPDLPEMYREPVNQQHQELNTQAPFPASPSDMRELTDPPPISDTGGEGGGEDPSDIEEVEQTPEPSRKGKEKEKEKQNPKTTDQMIMEQLTAALIAGPPPEGQEAGSSRQAQMEGDRRLAMGLVRDSLNLDEPSRGSTSGSSMLDKRGEKRKYTPEGDTSSQSDAALRKEPPLEGLVTKGSRRGQKRELDLSNLTPEDINTALPVALERLDDPLFKGKQITDLAGLIKSFILHKIRSWETDLRRHNMTPRSEKILSTIDCSRAIEKKEGKSGYRCLYDVYMENNGNGLKITKKTLGDYQAYISNSSKVSVLKYALKTFKKKRENKEEIENEFLDSFKQKLKAYGKIKGEEDPIYVEGRELLEPVQTQPDIMTDQSSISTSEGEEDPSDIEGVEQLQKRSRKNKQEKGKSKATEKDTSNNLDDKLDKAIRNLTQEDIHTAFDEAVERLKNPSRGGRYNKVKDVLDVI